MAFSKYLSRIVYHILAPLVANDKGLAKSCSNIPKVLRLRIYFLQTLKKLHTIAVQNYRSVWICPRIYVTRLIPALSARRPVTRPVVRPAVSRQSVSNWNLQAQCLPVVADRGRKERRKGSRKKSVRLRSSQTNFKSSQAHMHTSCKVIDEV